MKNVNVLKWAVVLVLLNEAANYIASCFSASFKTWERPEAAALAWALVLVGLALALALKWRRQDL